VRWFRNRYPFSEAKFLNCGNESEVWGGAYNFIVPTDGNTIKEEFWAILERYDPDYLYQYRYTLSDLKYADPEMYKRIANKRESQMWNTAKV
jgi:hypothetical protein